MGLEVGVLLALAPTTGCWGLPPHPSPPVAYSVQRDGTPLGRVWMDLILDSEGSWGQSGRWFRMSLEGVRGGIVGGAGSGYVRFSYPSLSRY